MKKILRAHYNTTEDTLKIRLMAATVSGFMCSFLSLPFDNAKTKMMKMVKKPDGTWPYKSIFHCINKSI